MSLIQPANGPPNCKFIRDDAEEPWIFQTPFDYIHLGVVFSCFDHPKALLQKIYDNLQPGGWVEYQDSALELIGSDPTADAVIQASPLARWASLFKAGLRNTKGRDPDVTRNLQGWMRELGFVDVAQRIIPTSLNDWSLDPVDKRIGTLNRRNMKLLVGASTKLVTAGGLPQEEWPVFEKAVQHNLGEDNMRGYWKCTYQSAPSF